MSIVAHNEDRPQRTPHDEFKAKRVASTHYLIESIDEAIAMFVELYNHPGRGLRDGDRLVEKAATLVEFRKKVEEWLP